MAFCRGTDVTVEFEENEYAGAGVFLFASVLQTFFGLYSAVNSFSRLTAKTSKGVLKRWPPLAGEQILFRRGSIRPRFRVRLLPGGTAAWAALPGRKPVGTTARPSDEIVRFGAWLSLAFPASAIDFIERIPDSEKPAR